MNEFDKLNEVRFSNRERVITVHININSLEKQILDGIYYSKIDTLLIAETKLGNPFPSNQFSWDGSSPLYRLDRY